MTNLKLRWNLFDGEGGTAGPGEGGLSAEASALLDEVTGRTRKGSESKSDTSQIQYGKSRDEGQTSQVGSDTQPAEDLQAEFAALIGKGGRYHDIYGQKVSDAIQSRFKNHSDLQGQVDQIRQAFDPVYQLYDVKQGDIEGLVNAIVNDEGMYTRGAERAGLDVQQYKENLKLRAEAERGRQISEAYERQQRQNEMFQMWEEQAAQLQQAFPNFDLGLEIQNNKQFARGLDSGLDVQTAFAAAHMDEILQGSTASAQRTATQQVVNTIRSRAMRPAEAGLQHSPAIVRKSDPSKLTNDDLDEIMRRVEAGESVSF